jgi:hypothetical protein
MNICDRFGYNFAVEITINVSAIVDICRWCNQEFNLTTWSYETKFKPNNSPGIRDYIFMFDKEEDAILFKLTWLNS